MLLLMTIVIITMTMMTIKMMTPMVMLMMVMMKNTRQAAGKTPRFQTKENYTDIDDDDDAHEIKPYKPPENVRSIIL